MVSQFNLEWSNHLVTCQRNFRRCHCPYTRSQKSAVIPVIPMNAEVGQQINVKNQLCCKDATTRKKRPSLALTLSTSRKACSTKRHGRENPLRRESCPRLEPIFFGCFAPTTLKSEEHPTGARPLLACLQAAQNAARCGDACTVSFLLTLISVPVTAAASLLEPAASNSI